MARTRDSGDFRVVDESEIAMDIRRGADSIWCSRRCARFAERLGFRDAALWEISIAVSELVTNVIKYAGSGSLRITALEQPVTGVEIEVEDEGPGIQDIDLVVNDGFSEGRMLDPDIKRGDRRGLGAGLGAVHRLMDEVEIANKPDRGARVVARKWLQPTG
jgi:serine/threonine-protein kinase RsbT